MPSYDDYAKKPASEKVTIAHIRAKERVKIFSLESGAIYSRITNFFVERVQVGTNNMVQANSPSLNQNEWYYSISESKLYVRMPDDSNPKANRITLTYKMFFCESPEILPYDLNTGSDVEYEARIKSTGALKLALDYENTGIAVESDSNVTFENTDGFFDEIFDTLIWENQECQFYSWSPSIPVQEKRLLYSGIIIDKSFSTREVSFRLKDQIYKLRDKIDLPVYSELDGEIDPSMNGKPKRLIFGRAKQVRTVGTDKVLDGFKLSGLMSGSTTRNLLTGTVSGITGQSQITGVGTLFLSELNSGDKVRVTVGITEYVFTVDTVSSNSLFTIDEVIPANFSLVYARNLNILNDRIIGIGTDFINEVSPEDNLKIEINGVEYSYAIEEVISATEVKTSDEIEVAFISQEMFNQPSVNYRRKNRTHNICGHKIREYQTTITEIIDAINFKVTSLGEIRQDDMIKIGSFWYIVTLVTGQQIRVNQGLDSSILVGHTVTRSPVRRVYVGSKELIYIRDWDYVNTISGADIELSELAEFNISRSQNPSVSFQFTNGSKQIDAIATTVDLTTVFKPRDWIRSRDITATQWYEIMSVEQDKIFIRTNYSGPTFSGLCQKRSPEYVGDDTLVTVDCYGLEEDGEWIKTASQSVKYLIQKIGFTNINNDSFDQAISDCQFAMSYLIPESVGSDAPIIREIISKINQSVFGSLFLSPDFEYKYSILNADRDESLTPVSDDDVIGTPTVTTKNQIVNKILMKYGPITDIFTEQDTLQEINSQSEFTDEVTEAQNTLTVTSYLYDYDDAMTIAERWLFFRSLSQGIVSVKTKLQFYQLGLNDQVYLDLDRLYKRYGGRDRKKIGIVNSINKTGDGIDLVFNDVGNIFNRVCVIAPDDQQEYALATRDEIAKYGFIVDNETETTDSSSEAELGSNLIG